VATVFIAYSYSDKELARLIARRLRGSGIRVWIDEQDIQPGDEIDSSIRAGLENSDAVVLVIGKGDHGDSWARREAALALSQKNKHVIPVLASRDADVPYIIRHLNALDLSDQSTLDAGLERLVRHLHLIDDLFPTRPAGPVNSARMETAQLASEVLRAEIDEYKSYRAKKNVAVVAGVMATAVVTAVIAAAAFWLPSLWFTFEDSEKYLLTLIGALIGVAGSNIAHRLTGYFVRRAERWEAERAPRREAEQRER